MVDFNSGKGSDVYSKLDGASVADMFTSFNEACPDLAEYISDFAFGHVLSRPGLGLRDRELAAVAALAALNTSERQLEVHLNAALNAGCKPQELVEVILQTLIFSGFPAAVNGMKTVQKVFKERGIVMTSGV